MARELYERRFPPLLIAMAVPFFFSGCMQWDTERYHAAVAGDWVNDVKQLLDKGVDIESKSYLGQTGLHGAARKRRTDLLRLLLDRGAKVDARDQYGFTPLHIAAGNGRLGTARLLIDAGAEVNARNMYGWTPVHVAAQHGANPLVIELLLANGADVNAKTSVFYTPLHLAAESGDTIVVICILLADKVDINARTYSDQTPLHLAVINGHADVVELLLEKGAAVNVIDKKSRTPLHEAVSSRRYEITGAAVYETLSGQRSVDYRGSYRLKADPQIVKLLTDKGADINAEDDKGQTPITFARENGLENIAALMLTHAERYASQAQARLKALQTAAWDEAIRRNTIDAFVDFYKQFTTNGPQVQEKILSLVSGVQVTADATELVHHVPVLLSGEKNILTELMPEARQGHGNKYIYTWKKTVFVWKCGWITYVAFPDEHSPLEFEVASTVGIPLVVPPLPLRYYAGKGIVIVLDSKRNQTKIYQFGGSS